MKTARHTWVLDTGRVEEARQRVAGGEAELNTAVEAIRREADEWMAKGPFSVMMKNLTPPSGDKHDYMSFGPYWWPDPSKKDGLPYIRRDGEVNPESAGPGSDRRAIEQMTAGAETLALAYYFTRDDRYAQRSALFLKTWFLNPETRMNPHLDFGQAIPGRTKGRGIGIIETHALAAVINSLALLEKSSTLARKDRDGIQEWFKAYVKWLRESDNGKQESREHNNHGTWYDFQLAYFALFTGDRETARDTVEGAVQKRLAAQVKEDGSQPNELARTRSFTYCMFNLNAFLGLAEIGKKVGVDFWAYPDPAHSRLKAAANFMAPYADPNTHWTGKQITPLRPADLVSLLRLAEASSGAGCEYERYFRNLPQGEVAADRSNLLWLKPRVK